MCIRYKTSSSNNPFLHWSPVHGLLRQGLIKEATLWLGTNEGQTWLPHLDPMNLFLAYFSNHHHMFNRYRFEQRTHFNQGIKDIHAFLNHHFQPEQLTQSHHIDLLIHDAQQAWHPCSALFFYQFLDWHVVLSTPSSDPHPYGVFGGNL